MTETKCRSTFLPDEPAQVDLFGSHSRVAAAIVAAIQMDDGGHAIGLIGPRGSGKSTISKIVESHFAGNDNIQFCWFDAWSHSGEPLRRAFLEILIQRLCKLGWLDAGNADESLESLRLRRDDTTTRTLLSPFGRSLAAGLLGFPFAIPFLNHLDWTYCLLGIFHSIPAWAFAAFWIMLLPIAASVGWLRTPQEDRRYVSILSPGTNTIAEGVTRKTPEPTSLEFAAIFHKVINSLHGSKKLMIILDNLDRVSAEESRPIWTSIRLFVEEARIAAVASTSRPRISFLIPLTREGIGDEIGAKADPDDSERSSLQKTFRAHFFVSEPIEPRARTYLVSQLAHALPDHARDEFERIYLLYSIKTQHRFGSPRNALAFINDLVALHLQFGEDIPLLHQALFALLRNDLRTPQDLLVPNILGSIPISLVGDQWKESLAAIFFNVRRSDALYVLEAPIIDAALGRGDQAEMSRLSATPGFEVVLRRILAENGDTSATNPVFLARAASSLVGIEDHDRRRDLFAILEPSAARVETWPSYSRGDAVGSAALIEYIDNRELVAVKAPKILAELANGVKNESAGLREYRVTIDAWLERFLIISEACVRRLGPSVLSDFELVHDEAFQFELLHTAKGAHATAVTGHLNPSVISDAIYTSCENGALLRYDAAVEASFSAFAKYGDWASPLVAKLQDGVRNVLTRNAALANLDSLACALFFIMAAERRHAAVVTPRLSEEIAEWMISADESVIKTRGRALEAALLLVEINEGRRVEFTDSNLEDIVEVADRIPSVLGDGALLDIVERIQKGIQVRRNPTTVAPLNAT